MWVDLVSRSQVCLARGDHHRRMRGVDRPRKHQHRAADQSDEDEHRKALPAAPPEHPPDGVDTRSDPRIVRVKVVSQAHGVRHSPISSRHCRPRQSASSHAAPPAADAVGNAWSTYCGLHMFPGSHPTPGHRHHPTHPHFADCRTTDPGTRVTIECQMKILSERWQPAC